MKITLLQTDIKWCCPTENIARAEKLILDAEKSDIYVLPEMFSTGFCMSPEKIAEPVGGDAFSFMMLMAKRMDAAIVGSVAVEDNGAYFNRMYFCKPDGTFEVYDKHHLFTFSGEDKVYSPGSERVVVEFRGVRILLLVCYDLRFPVFARNRNDYDMIVCVANWPRVRRYPWCALAKARAIENLCYVAAVNRGGTDEWGDYSGDSMLIDPYGQPVAECKEGVEDVITATVDLDVINNFRDKFPALRDADDFILR